MIETPAEYWAYCWNVVMTLEKCFFSSSMSASENIWDIATRPVQKISADHQANLGGWVSSFGIQQHQTWILLAMLRNMSWLIMLNVALVPSGCLGVPKVPEIDNTFTSYQHGSLLEWIWIEWRAICAAAFCEKIWTTDWIMDLRASVEKYSCFWSQNYYYSMSTIHVATATQRTVE